MLKIICVLFLLVAPLAAEYKSNCECPKDEEPGQKSCNNCEPSCDNLYPEVCTKINCDCSCDCVPGLVRDKSSKKCVPKEKCPAPKYPCQCPENEQPGQKKCNLCEPSCDNFNPEICTQIICDCSCDCVPGFVRDKVSKKCVPNDKCPYQKKEAED